MTTSLRTDIHLYPLYLKWASDFFRCGNADEGKRFFKLVCSKPHDIEYKVYQKLWRIKSGVPQGDPEFGRKTFHDRDGLSSSLEEKAQAIDRVLRSFDRNELTSQENQIHKNLWINHGMPQFDLQYGRHAFYYTHGQSSTFVEKRFAARNYAEDLRICRFNTRNFLIDVIKRENGNLECLIHPINSEFLHSIFLEQGNLTLERLIEKIQKNLIWGENDGRPIPINNFQTCSYFSTFTFSGNKKLNLLQSSDGQFIWRAFDHETKMSSWVWPCEADIQIFNRLMRLPEDERSSYAMEFTAKATWQEDRIASVSLAHPSQLDPTQTVDSENSAITLIYGGQASDSDPWEAGHAMIIYEGIKEGKYFIKIAHLRGDMETGKAKIQIKEISSVKYEGKTPTWIRPNHLAERLEQEEGKIYLFNMSGNLLLEPINRGIYNAFGPPILTVKTFIKDSTQDSIGDRLCKAIHTGINHVSVVKENQAYNCTTWAIHGCRLIGINLPCLLPHRFAEPKRYVEYIASNPHEVRFEE